MTGACASREKIGHEDGEQQSIQNETSDGLSQESSHAVFGNPGAKKLKPLAWNQNTHSHLYFLISARVRWNPIHSHSLILDGEALSLHEPHHGLVLDEVSDWTVV